MSDLHIHELSWFVDHIGDIIYRINNSDCNCYICASTREIVVLGGKHARDLFEYQTSIGSRYSDVKK